MHELPLPLPLLFEIVHRVGLTINEQSSDQLTTVLIVGAALFAAVLDRSKLQYR